MTGFVPKVMLAVATVAVIAVVAGALVVLDSPAVAAEKRRDAVLASDLACMHRRIVTTYHNNKALPAASEVTGLACRNDRPPAPGITYLPTGPDTYRLCATFRYAGEEQPMAWEHPAGYHCFNKRAAERD